MTKFKTISTEIDNNVLLLTLNRPKIMNAVNETMIEEIITAIDDADENDNVRAIVFTGAGKAYCAGADLSSGDKTFDWSKKEKSNGIHRDGGGRVTLRLFDCKKPIIGAINGAAVGFGATMQLPMDIRIASEKARFGFVFSRRGVVPEACSSWFLPRLVGVSKALQWCYSGEVFSAKDAHEAGLVSEIVGENELIDRAKQIASQFIDSTAPISVALIRQMMWKMLGANHPMEAHKIDSRGIYFLGQGADTKEGVMSFLEKRQPVFPGKISQDMPDFFPWWDEKTFE